MTQYQPSLPKFYLCFVKSKAAKALDSDSSRHLDNLGLCVHRVCVGWRQQLSRPSMEQIQRDQICLLLWFVIFVTYIYFIILLWFPFSNEIC